MIRTFLYALTITLFFGTSALAADKELDNQQGTLASYIAYAMENSPALDELYEQWNYSVYSIAKTKRIPDPTISYSYFIRSVETRVGPQRHKLSLKQSFPWPTKITTGSDVASSKAESNRQQFEAFAIEIASKIEIEYWTLWILLESQKIHQEHLALLHNLSESVSALVTTGKTTMADLQQLALKIALLEDLIFNLQEEIHQSKTRLKGIMSAPQSMEITISSTPLNKTIAIDEKELIVSLKNHPRIISYQKMSQASSYEAKQESSQRLPGFNIGLDWIETGKREDIDVPENGKDAWAINLGVSIPLWQTNYKQNIKAKNSQRRVWQAKEQNELKNAVANFHSIISKINNESRRIKLYQENLMVQAQAVFDSVLGSYISGQENISSLILAEKTLLDLKVKVIEAKGEQAKQIAALENILGHSVTQNTKGVSSREDQK